MDTLNNTPRIITIQLTQGFETTVDEIDADLAQYKWSAQTSHNGKHNPYVRRKVNSKPIFIHQVILSRMLNRPLEKGEKVDHKNLNPLNNQRENLRLATHQQNMQNTPCHSHNKTGLKGVQKHRNKWRSVIRLDGKRIRSKSYDTPEEAHEAYIRTAKEHFGEFARG